MMHTITIILMQIFISAQGTSDDSASVDKLVDALADKLVGKLFGLVPATASSAVRGSMWPTTQHHSSRNIQANVAPYRDWKQGTAQQKLEDQGLQMVTPERAFKMVKDDEAIIVDVRPDTGVGLMTADGGRRPVGKPQGAVSVPLFRKVSGNTPKKIIQRMVVGIGLGKPAVERDPDWMPNFQQKMAEFSHDGARNPTVIIACNRGGSLPNEWIPSERYGRIMDAACYTQSLQAAYDLYEAGYPSAKVRVLKGGIPDWEAKGLPMADSTQNDPRPN
jgi:rhodanese-related sulfurtransferase